MQVWYGWGAFVMSCVSRNPRFSVARGVQTLTRASLADDHARDELFLLSTTGQTSAGDDLLARAAAAIWCKIWSPPHQYPETRRPARQTGSDRSTGSLQVQWPGRILYLFVFISLFPH